MTPLNHVLNLFHFYDTFIKKTCSLTEMGMMIAVPPFVGNEQISHGICVDCWTLNRDSGAAIYWHPKR